MPTEAPTLDIAEILGTEEVPIERWSEIRREVHCSIDLRSSVEELAENFAPVAKKLSSENKAETRRGAALWILGRTEEAAQALAAVRSTKESEFLLGLAHLETGRAEAAEAALKKAREAEGDHVEILSALAQAHVRRGQLDEATDLVDRLQKKHADRPDTHYLRGLCHELAGDHAKAGAAYDKALEKDPGHPRTLFRLAAAADLYGEDERAIEYYEQLRKGRPLHVNAMINLGILYDDRGDTEKAIECYRAVLEYHPNHERARLYLRDAHATLNMYYDEEIVKREEKVHQLLSTPLGDFQLSARSRNCLVKLGLLTLGDIVAKTEEELLGVENFGQSSLKEIKELLNSRGLSLALSKDAPGVPSLGGEGGPAPEALLKSVHDYEWPGRVRKAFEKFNISTFGDLLKYSEKDMLKSKNLGMTSIKEIRKKLASVGLKMKEE